MPPVKDLRKTPASLAECDELLSQLATVEINLALRRAQAEKAIDQIKTDLEADTALDRQQKVDLETRITAYVEQHKDQFQKPRKHKTDFGSYGLQLATEVEVFDQEALVQHCANHGILDCLKITTKPVSSAIKARIENDERLPGVRINSGDLAVVNVSKAIIDEALT